MLIKDRRKSEIVMRGLGQIPRDKVNGVIACYLRKINEGTAADRLVF